MISLLNKKCPVKFFWVYPKIGSLILAGYLSILLFLFRPYELQSFKFPILLLSCIICGSICGITYWTTFQSIKKYLNENWTYGKDLIWLNVILLIIGILNYLAFNFIHSSTNIYVEYSVKLTFLESILYSLLIGWFTYIFISLSNDALLRFNFFKKFKKQPEIAENLTYPINNQPLVEKNLEKKVALIGKNSEDLIEIQPDLFLFAQAQGNYVDIFTLNSSDGLEVIMFRNSVKEIKSQMKNIKYIYKCHRSFLVNLNYVNEIIGTNKSKTLVITLEDKKFKIPLSRLKNKEFEDIYSLYS